MLSRSRDYKTLPHGRRPGWRADIQVIELPILASCTQARTGLTVPGKGLWGGKGARWTPPGSWIGWLDHRAVLVTPLGPLSQSNHSRVKPITNQEVSAHLGPMPPYKSLLSSLIQMLISKVDPAGHLPGLQSPPQTLESSCPAGVPRGCSHALLPTQGGRGLREQCQQEHGSPLRPQQERVPCQVFWSWIPREAPRRGTQATRALQLLHIL